VRCIPVHPEKISDLLLAQSALRRRDPKIPLGLRDHELPTLDLDTKYSKRQICTHLGGDVIHGLSPYPILEKSLQSDPPHLLHPVLVLLDVPALALTFVFGGRPEHFLLHGGGVGGSLLLARRFLGRRRGLGFSVVGADIGLCLRAWTAIFSTGIKRDEFGGLHKIRPTMTC
jgi:hypothetical protein